MSTIELFPLLFRSFSLWLVMCTRWLWRLTWRTRWFLFSTPSLIELPIKDGRKNELSCSSKRFSRTLCGRHVTSSGLAFNLGWTSSKQSWYLAKSLRNRLMTTTVVCSVYRSWKVSSVDCRFLIVPFKTIHQRPWSLSSFDSFDLLFTYLNKFFFSICK